MRETTVRCCRCDDLIEAEGSILDPTAGPLRKRRTTPYDLCPRCSEAFVSWLSPTLPVLEPTEPVEPLTVPA